MKKGCDTMQGKFWRMMAAAGCVAGLLAAVAPARGEGSAIGVRLAGDEFQVGSAGEKAFYVQWRTPAGEWLDWAEASLPEPQASCVWLRAMYEGDDPFQWEAPASISGVYTPACAAGGWVTIGRMDENGVCRLVSPADFMPPAPVFEAPPVADPSATAANNQVKGRPDPGLVKVYWYNTSSRLVACWGLTETGALKSAGYSNDGGMTSNWLFRGLGDINRDGVDDILWHNSSSRMVAYWIMAADGYIARSGLCTNTPMAAGWDLRGVGDIDADGTADVLWHNSSTRRVAYWLLNPDGTLKTSGFCTTNTMATSWVMSGVGDINQDGTSDALWYNSSTRRVAYWMLATNGALDASGFCTTNTMSSAWEFRATGDIDADGTLDIFWHNSTTKRVAYWILNSDGSLRTSGYCNDGAMSGGWVLSAAGDINNDDTSDLIWYNTSSRATAYWMLNTNGLMTTSGYCNASAMASGWSLTGAGL